MLSPKEVRATKWLRVNHFGEFYLISDGSQKGDICFVCDVNGAYAVKQCVIKDIKYEHELPPYNDDNLVNEILYWSEHKRITTDAEYSARFFPKNREHFIASMEFVAYSSNLENEDFVNVEDCQP